MGLKLSVAMIYLIGVNHGLQFVNKTSDDKTIDAFDDYVRDLCTEQGIRCIAEEMSIEALNKWGATRYLCKSIADELSIKHIFSDPDSDERKSRGIRSEKEIRDQLGYTQVLSQSQVKKVDEVLKAEWPRREQFWLEKILEVKAAPILFVLGSSHIESFSNLLTREAIDFKILARKWEA